VSGMEFSDFVLSRSIKYLVRVAQAITCPIVAELVGPLGGFTIYRKGPMSQSRYAGGSTMSNDILLTATGASLATIASLLILTRLSWSHRRISLLRFALAWVRMPPSRALPVVIGLFAIALTVFSWTGAGSGAWASINPSPGFSSAQSTDPFALPSGDPDVSDTQTLSALRAYVGGLPHRPATHAFQTPRPDAPNDLPDVDTMIQRLAERLETEGDDKDGWRMLGWSYFHTERFADAVRAYETLLTLDPANAEVKSALTEARSKMAAAAPVAAAPSNAPKKN
jgi:hypothetical protein